MQTGLSKKYPEKVHSPEQTERGLDGLRCLSEPQIIPLQISIASHQIRTNGVIGEEQYHINNPP